MKLTNTEVFELYNTLIALTQDSNIKLPVRVGFLLVRDIKILTPIYESINQMRQNIVNQYSINDKNQNEIENLLFLANSQLEELGKIEEDVDLFTINLKDIENLTLSLGVLNILQLIIKGED